MKLSNVKLSVDVVSEMLTRAKRFLEVKTERVFAGERYAACVFTDKNCFYEGKNIFSPTLNLSLHAEQTAIMHAELHNDSRIIGLALVSSDERHSPIPCGICRQLLFENARFSKYDIQIVTEFSERRHFHKISELYPNPWPNREPKRIK
jgi:cytidine deaminase